MPRFIQLLFVLLICLYSCTLRAQGNASASQILQQDIDFPVFQVDEGVSSYFFKIQNGSAVNQLYSLEVKSPEGLNLLSTTTQKLLVKANKNRFVDLKFELNPRYNIQGKFLEIIVRDEKGEVYLQQRMLVQVAARRAIQLMNITDFQLINKGVDSIYVKLQLRNSGTTNERIKLIYSSPNRIGNRTFQELSIPLAAAADSILKLSIKVEPYMLKLPQFQVYVSALYEGEEVFSTQRITFSTSSSNQNFSALFGDNSPVITASNANNIEFLARNFTKDNASYTLNTRAEFNLRNAGKLAVNLFAFEQGSFKNLPNLSNTFVKYQQRNNEWTLGNIQENVGVSFYGRGMKYQYVDSTHDNTISTAIIDKTYSLLDPIRFSASGSEGISAFVNVVHGLLNPERRKVEALLFYDYNRSDGNQHLFMQQRWGIFKQQFQDRYLLEVEMGLGLSKHQATEALVEDIYKPSFSVGVKGGATIHQFIFQSDNYYSSAYYPGNRMGLIQLNQRVSRRIGNKNLGLNLSYYNSQPKYLGVYALRLNRVSNLTGVATFSTAIANNVSWSIQPTLVSETMDSYYNLSVIRPHLKNIRLNNTFSFHSRDFKHSSYLNIEQGISKTSLAAKPEFVIRNSFSYSFQKFSVNASYQRGVFQLVELMNSISSISAEKVLRLTVGPSYRSEFMQGKLHANVMLNYNRLNTSGNLYQGIFDFNYAVSRKTKITGNIQFSQLSNSQYQYQSANFQLGIRQELPKANENKQNKGKLTVRCFYDLNNNQQLDPGEELAQDYGFLLEQMYCLTDKSGKALCSQIPYGDYVISFPSKNGWSSTNRPVQINHREQSIAIPLQKIYKVVGAINIDYNEHFSLSVNTDPSDYQIQMVDEFGHRYMQRTDNKGEYEFNVPAGIYTISISPDNFPSNISAEQLSYKLEVKEGQVNQARTFELQVKSKKVEVKRFGSPKK